MHFLADVSVAIVSLCSYSALDTPLTALSASNKVAYARHHGYRLFFETTVMDKTRPIPWSKVKASKSMTMCPSNPHDSLFVSIHSHLPDSGLAEAPGRCRLGHVDGL